MAAVAPDDVQETVNALMHMAREFEEDECPLQAVKCYEAICNKNHLTVLPLPEARARVALSRLLLEYTDNVHRAKTHLETTQMLLRNVHGYESLKCATYSGLSRCYRLMGPDLRRQQTDAVQRGLDMSRGVAKKHPDDASWRAWELHFLLEKAQLKMSAGDFRMARKTIAEGSALAAGDRDDADAARNRALFALAQLQRAIAQCASGMGVGSGREAAGRDADAAMKALADALGPEACPSLRLHHRALRALGRLAAGDVAAAAGDPAEMKALLAEREGEDEDEGDARETVGSAWLPAPAARAFARLLWAEAVRPLGQFKEARRELEAALRECDDALNVLGVLPEGGDPIEARKQEDAALMGVSPAASPVKKRKGKSREAVPPARAPQSRQWVGSEADLSLRTGADASPYLTIRLLALQSLVGIDLTSTKLDDAASRAEAMRTMVEAYPRTLRRTAAAADVAEGQTLHSLGREAEAAVRFAAAAETAEAFGAPATRDLACVCGALSELADGSPEAISRALNLVRPVLARHERAAEEAANAAGGGKEKDKDAAPNYAYQAAALFVSGYATLRQGEASQEAKPKLSRALKLAHSQCCNHQLVAQSLSLIGTIVLDARGGDLSQSLDMLQSSFTLSKAQEDVPAQLGCLQSLLRLHRLRGSSEEEQGQLTSYSRRKRGAYEAILAAATEDEERLERLAAGGFQDEDEEMSEEDIELE